MEEADEEGEGTQECQEDEASSSCLGGCSFGTIDMLGGSVLDAAQLELRKRIKAVAPLTHFWGRPRGLGGLGLGAQRTSCARGKVHFETHMALDFGEDDKYEETEWGKKLRLPYDFENGVVRGGENGKK